MELAGTLFLGGASLFSDPSIMFALLAHTKSSTVTLTSLFEQHDAKHTAKNHEADNSFCACPQIYAVCCLPLCPLPALATSRPQKQRSTSISHSQMQTCCQLQKGPRRSTDNCRTLGQIVLHIDRKCARKTNTALRVRNEKR